MEAKVSVFYHSIYNIDTASIAGPEVGLAGFGLLGLIGLVGLASKAHERSRS